ncbi:MAG: DUF697 domain-containing protein [Bacteroidetes bacterium]|nr:MAG: DUF697 domain-containing protein [Bacteroidota bacterium]
MEDNFKKRQESEEIVKSHILWSMGAGSVPLPIIDVIAVTYVQSDMLKQLSRIYGVSYEESAGKNFVSAVASSSLARLGASFIKGIPGIGSWLGGVSMAILSGASTYALGQVFINHFDNGGNLFNFDLDWAKKFYEQNFEKGKAYATDLNNKEKEKKQEETPDKATILKKLEDLVELKKQGIITEDEFKAKREEWLKKLNL